MVPFPRRLPHTTSPVEGAGFEPSVPGAKEPVSFAEGELRGIERGRPTKVISLRGTDGSNPSPSSAESRRLGQRAQAVTDRDQPGDQLGKVAEPGIHHTAPGRADPACTLDRPSS